MPRKSRGAYLYHRKNRNLYEIRDGSRVVGTGTGDRREAETALAQYIAEKDQPNGPRRTDQMTVEEALSIYGEEHGVTVRAPATIGYAIMALRPILGPLPVASINKEQCRRYARTRGVKPGTVRRELGVLQAALNHCHAQGYLLTPVKVTLSPPPSPRDRCLTRDEAAKLLRAAWRNPKSKHLARFILTAIHTGTRSGAILNLRFMAHTQGVYVDTESGMMYRRGAGQAETKKRQPPIPIPRPLLAHMRRWKRTAHAGLSRSTADGLPASRLLGRGP